MQPVVYVPGQGNTPVPTFDDSPSGEQEGTPSGLA